MNSFSISRTLKVTMTFALLLIASLTFAGNETDSNDAFKQGLKQNMNTDVLKANGLEAAKVLVIFTVEADNSIHILNAASMQQPIKEYVTEILEGKVTTDLRPGEAYQMMISFKRF
jgi:tagatose-1,6-bisphosphate aldolase